MVKDEKENRYNFLVSSGWFSDINNKTQLSKKFSEHIKKGKYGSFQSRTSKFSEYWLSSILTLTRDIFPLAFNTSLSSIGANCLHGEHHGAQKSTTIGFSFDASTTSLTKSSEETFLISSFTITSLLSSFIGFPEKYY